jgi:heterodisulfide reductase subunit C2
MEAKLSSLTVHSNFVKKVEELSGQDLLSCYQCGKCSAGCPIAEDAEILPNQIVRLVQLGQREDALNSRTIWLCASCYTCMCRCPRGVDLSRVMEALRQMVLRKRMDHVNVRGLGREAIADLPPIALIGNFRKFTG